ncbi:MAG: pro-sigmaK processing inhibitor BofA family protein [Candidatus Micrarchaeota archaeon]
MTLAAAATPAATVISFSQSDLIILAGILIFVALIVLVLLKRFIVNSILGVIALIILNSVGVSIPINFVTMLVAAVLGLVGIALLVILKLAGISI